MQMKNFLKQLLLYRDKMKKIKLLQPNYELMITYINKIHLGENFIVPSYFYRHDYFGQFVIYVQDQLVTNQKCYCIKLEHDIIALGNFTDIAEIENVLSNWINTKSDKVLKSVKEKLGMTNANNS